MELNELLPRLEEAQKKALLELAASQVTAERQALIDRVLPQRTRHLAVVLENIFQPHNASAVLRSCDLFGVQDVYILENRNSYQVNRDVALGSAQWLTLHRYRQPDPEALEACAADLRQAGYRLVATTLRTGSKPVAEMDPTVKSALMFGTEMQGLTDAAHALADEWVHLPMVGFTQSFNISVSVALFLYDLTHRLRPSGVSWQLSPEEAVDLKIRWLLNAAARPDALLRHFVNHMNPLP